MSEHVRKQIRNAVKEALQGLGSTGDRVFISRVYPLTQAKLPGILIFTPAEDSGREDTAMGVVPEILRVITLQVHGIVAITGNLEDEMDDIALEVEAALDNLGDADIAKNYHGIQGTITTLSGEEAEKPHGAIAMEFLYTVHTASGAPDVPL